MFKTILSEIAPILGTLVGGPVGAAAGKMINGILGLSNTATEKEQEIALKNATPEQLIAIKKLEYEYKTNIENINFKNNELLIQDSISARDLQKESDGWLTSTLSIAITVGVFLVVFALFFDDHMPENNVRVFDMLIGTLSTAWLQVLSFRFGRFSFKNKK